jgi:hypothetical protein
MPFSVRPWSSLDKIAVQRPSPNTLLQYRELNCQTNSDGMNHDLRGFLFGAIFSAYQVTRMNYLVSPEFRAALTTADWPVLYQDLVLIVWWRWGVS